MDKRTICLKASARHPTLPEGTVYEALGPQALQDLAFRRATSGKRSTTAAVDVLNIPVKRKYKRRDMSAE